MCGRKDDRGGCRYQFDFRRYFRLSWADRPQYSAKRRKMDDLDDHLLARLRDNARAPVAELARALGLSRTTVQSRLARLERSGVIAGYAVKLSEAREAALIHAFVMLTVEPKQAA